MQGLAGDFFASAAAPLKALLARNPIDLGNVSAVELLGGGTRVPRLQAALGEALGGRGLDKCAPCPFDPATIFSGSLPPPLLVSVSRCVQKGFSTSPQISPDFSSISAMQIFGCPSLSPADE